jgi:hypothetical protein
LALALVVCGWAAGPQYALQLLWVAQGWRVLEVTVEVAGSPELHLAGEFFFLIIVWGGVHCGIYKSFYNISNMSYLNFLLWLENLETFA